MNKKVIPHRNLASLGTLSNLPRMDLVSFAHLPSIGTGEICLVDWIHLDRASNAFAWTVRLQFDCSTSGRKSPSHSAPRLDSCVESSELGSRTALVKVNLCRRTHPVESYATKCHSIVPKWFPPGNLPLGRFSPLGRRKTLTSGTPVDQSARRSWSGTRFG